MNNIYINAEKFLKLILLAKYKILILLISSLILVLYLKSNYKIIYKLEATVHYNNLFDTKKVHSDLTELKRSIYNKLDRSGFLDIEGNTMGDKISHLYKKNYNEYLNNLYTNIYVDYSYYLKKTNIIPQLYENNVSKLYSEYNNKDKIFFIEIYNYDKSLLENSFNQSLEYINNSIKQNYTQIIKDIRYDVEDYVDYKKEEYEFFVKLKNSKLFVTQIENARYILFYTLDILEKAEKLESKLINHLNSLNIFGDNIEFRIISKEFQLYVHLAYLFLLSFILGTLFQFIISISKRDK